MQSSETDWWAERMNCSTTREEKENMVALINTVVVCLIRMIYAGVGRDANLAKYQ